MSSIRYPSGRPYTLDWRCRPTTSSTPSFANAYSLQFDGVNDYVDVGTSINALFDLALPFTVTGWVYPLSQPGYSVLFDNSVGILGALFGFTPVASLYLFMGTGTNYGYATTADGTLLSNVWSLVTATYDGSGNIYTGTKIYINAVLTPTTIFGGVASPTGSSVSPASLRIGGQQGAGNGYFNGYIDEPSVWNRVLTQLEVTELYNSGAPTNLLAHSAAANLAHWWRDGDTPDTIASIADRVGTATGTPTNMAPGALQAFVP